MALTSRADLLAPAKRRFKNLTLPVSGHTVRIRSLLEGEKESYEAELFTAKGDQLRKDKLTNARRRLVLICLVNDNGERLLSDADIDQLKALDGADMAYLQGECQAHCGFSKGDIEGLVKNSETVHADA